MQNVSKILAAATLGLTLALPTMLPANAEAQTSHRQKTKNTWRNVGIAGAAAGVAGLLTHNKTLAIGGAAAGIYGASRYEHDRKSQSKAQAAYRRRHHYAAHHYTTRRHR